MFDMYLIKNGDAKEVTENFSDVIYDSELDNQNSVILDICEIFEEVGNIKFVVSGFGEDEWKLSCYMDLPCIIEDLPFILKKIKAKDYNFDLDFYEQGVSRKITFVDSGEYVTLKASSWIDWEPNPSETTMNKADIDKMIINLHTDFATLGKELCEHLMINPMFADWYFI